MAQFFMISTITIEAKDKKEVEKLEVMYPKRESDEYDAGNEDMRNKVLAIINPNISSPSEELY